MADKLIQLARKKIDLYIGDLEIENSYWISSTEKMNEIDESGDFCYDCAKKKVEELTKKLGKKIDIDGVKLKSDSIICCTQCGKLLSYSLTEEGLQSELEHFIYLQTDDTLYSKREAYQIKKILDCYEGCCNGYKYKGMIIELINKLNFNFKNNEYFCYDCAKKKVEKSREKIDIFVDKTQKSGIICCNQCGKLLEQFFYLQIDDTITKSSLQIHTDLLIKAYINLSLADFEIAFKKLDIEHLWYQYNNTYRNNLLNFMNYLNIKERKMLTDYIKNHYWVTKNNGLEY